MAMSLTRNQMDCARVIAELTAQQGRPPTFAEIGDDLDLSRPNVSRLINGLEERGWLAARAKGKPRALVLLHQPPTIEECAIEMTPEGLQRLAEEEKADYAAWMDRYRKAQVYANSMMADAREALGPDATHRAITEWVLAGMPGGGIDGILDMCSDVLRLSAHRRDEQEGKA